MFNLFLTIAVPAYGLFTGRTTLFWIVYLYWWHELIATVLDAIYFRKHPASSISSGSFGARLFLLAVHLVFIVVLFGFMNNRGADRIIRTNLMVLLFKEHLFTANLFGILLNELWWRLQPSSLPRKAQDPFSGRMLVMHLSIIFGGVFYMMVVRRLPLLFTPDNLWGTVLVAAPFLLLKAYADRRAAHAGQDGQ